MDRATLRRHSRTIAVAAAIICSVGAHTTARAQNVDTWDGGGGNDDWGTGDNWADNSAPSLSSEIHFAGSMRLTPFYNYGSFDPMYRIYFDAGASAFTLNGNSIKLADFSGNAPKIENNTVGVLQTVSFANIAFNGSGEINPVDGDLLISLQSGAGNIYLDNFATLSIYGNNGHTVKFDSVISNGNNAGAFSVRHNSIVVFSRQNTYTGSTAIDAGTLLVAAGTSIGNNSAVFVGNGSTDALPGFAQLYANTDATVLMSVSGLTLNNSISTNKADTGSGIGTGKRRIGGTFTSGTGTFSGDISLNGGAVLTAAAGGTVRFTGAIENGSDSGNVSHSITKESNGTVILTNANTYTGTTAITAGVLNIQNNTALGATAGNTTISNGRSCSSTAA